jgi:hypothetical protein
MATCGRRRGSSGTSASPEEAIENEDDQAPWLKCLVAAVWWVEPPIGMEPMTYALRGLKTLSSRLRAGELARLAASDARPAGLCPLPAGDGR